MSKSPKSSLVSRRLRVESLEDRRLMAGDVTAQLFNGTLVVNEAIEAKGQASDISILRLANGNLRVSANAGGRVNGQAFVDFVGKSASSLNVDLGDGNDRLQITDVAFQNVDIVMGKLNTIVGDNDVVSIRGLATRGSLNIATGDGADSVTVTRSQIGNGLADAGETTADQLLILTGKGADAVTIGDATNLTQVKGMLHINTTSDLALAIDGTPNQTELGNDNVVVTNVEVTDNVDVWLGGGVNTLDMVGVAAGNFISVYGGAGQDTARLRDVTGRNGVFARMGAGNDRLELNNVQAPFGVMRLDGGAGVDTLIRTNSTGQSLFLANWE